MDNTQRYEQDLYAPVSFGGGGGGGDGGGGGAVRGAIGVANAIADSMDPNGGNPGDPQGVWGRPTFDEGDAYSGDQNYGDPDGR